MSDPSSRTFVAAVSEATGAEPSSGIVGRAAELTSVDEVVQTARDRFTALLVEGEPGIGKTTVWREAIRRAVDRGARVLDCRPAAAEAKLSFAAIADLLEGIDEALFERLPAPQRDALAVALLRAAPTGEASLARAVAAGFLGVVRAMALEQPLVVAVDDWQWLDPASRSVLEFAARRLDSERVGLVCAIRSPLARPPLGGAVPSERMRRIALGSLSAAALGRIVAEQLGRSLPRPLLVRIAQASRGNPFYALEVALLMTERGADAPRLAALPVPDDLRQLTRRRLRRLPSSTREALLLAAVLSDPDSQLVDIGALTQAETAGIVSIDTRGRIEFTHPLFASAAYGSAPAARRRALHRQAAALVSDPEQRARHLALGADRPDALIAAGLDEAAALAASRGAPDAAAELVELAAQLSPKENVEERLQRLLEAARFHFDSGDPARADILAQQVLAGSPPDLLRARALQLLAQLRARYSNFTEAAQLAAAALEAASDDHRLSAAIELDLVYCAVSLGDVAGAEPHARAAVEHAQTAGEDGILADALAVLTMAEFLSGRGLDRARLDRAIALESPIPASAFMMRPRIIRGLLELWSGELEGALDALGGVHAETLERGLEGTAPMMALYLVWAHVWRGDFEQAARVGEQAREAAALLEDPTTSGLALSASALVHAHDGRTELALAEAEEALSLFARIEWRSGAIWPLWAVGLAHLSEGQPAAVDAVLGPLADHLAAAGPVDPVMASFLPDEIEALIALGRIEEAEAHLKPFEASARRLDRAWALAVGGRCRGALEGARGDSSAALAAFERALVAHERAPMPFERARTLLLAGQVQRRFKQRGPAREQLGEALEIFERVGAPLWADKARAELARVGRPRSGSDELTDTERRLAELAASGLSNREIADRAFVTVKTVEANLTRVYRKLGVGSRVQLANALRAAGPLARSP